MTTFRQSPVTGRPLRRPERTRFRRAIYALFVPSGTCLYVGQSIFPKQRERQHRKDSRLQKCKFWLAVLRWAKYPDSHRIEGQVIQAFQKRGQACLNLNISGGNPNRPSSIRRHLSAIERRKSGKKAWATRLAKARKNQ